jgi:hypothetical protein
MSVLTRRNIPEDGVLQLLLGNGSMSKYTEPVVVANGLFIVAILWADVKSPSMDRNVTFKSHFCLNSFLFLGSKGNASNKIIHLAAGLFRIQ